MRTLWFLWSWRPSLWSMSSTSVALFGQWTSNESPGWQVMAGWAYDENWGWEHAFILTTGLELQNKFKLTVMSSSKRRAVLTESPLVNWAALDMGTSWRFSLFIGPYIWGETAVRSKPNYPTNAAFTNPSYIFHGFQLLERHTEVGRRQCGDAKGRLRQRWQRVRQGCDSSICTESTISLGWILPDTRNSRLCGGSRRRGRSC